MPTLRQGASGARVQLIQRIVGVTPDGEWGPATDQAVRAYQRVHGLVPDGAWGPKSMDAAWAHLEDSGLATSFWSRQRLVQVALEGDRLDELVAKKVSFARLRLREDAAAAFRELQAELVAAGGTMTTAGGTRGLRADVGANRSPFSEHYIGTAFDLGVYSGMNNPERDPFIATLDPERDRFWRIYAAAPGGDLRELLAHTRAGTIVNVRRRVVDFTTMAARHGFHPIPCRRSTWATIGLGHQIANPGGLEWWHFQLRDPARIPGQTAWGDALLSVYPYHVLRGTAPWALRHATYTYGGVWI